MNRMIAVNTNYTVRWFVTIFCGLVFAASGAAKLVGDPVFTSWFQDFGIPLYLMRALGVVEIMGAIALCSATLARYANVGFLIIAAGAAVMHLIYGHPVAALLPTALATAAAIAVWGTPGHPAAPPKPKVLTKEPTEIRWEGDLGVVTE
jgi:putative oxidoreductase